MAKMKKNNKKNILLILIVGAIIFIFLKSDIGSKVPGGQSFVIERDCLASTECSFSISVYWADSGSKDSYGCTLYKPTTPSSHQDFYHYQWCCPAYFAAGDPVADCLNGKTAMNEIGAGSCTSFKADCDNPYGGCSQSYAICSQPNMRYNEYRGYNWYATSANSRCGGPRSATCGDGQCTSLETPESCAVDCVVCGDGQCIGSESPITCFSDCGCGNGVCNSAIGETRDTCSPDCGSPNQFNLEGAILDPGQSKSQTLVIENIIASGKIGFTTIFNLTGYGYDKQNSQIYEEVKPLQKVYSFTSNKPITECSQEDSLSTSDCLSCGCEISAISKGYSGGAEPYLSGTNYGNVWDSNYNTGFTNTNGADIYEYFKIPLVYTKAKFYIKDYSGELSIDVPTQCFTNTMNPGYLNIIMGLYNGYNHIYCRDTPTSGIVLPGSNRVLGIYEYRIIWQK